MSGYEGWFLVAAWSTPALAWGLAELSLIAVERRCDR